MAICNGNGNGNDNEQYAIATRMINGNGNSKQFGTKSKTFGRMMASELERDDAKGGAGNKGGSRRDGSLYGTTGGRVSRKASMSRRANQDDKSFNNEAAAGVGGGAEDDSYGAESYDYDNEVSYYSSEEDDEEIKEQLEYDDGNEFTPERPYPKNKTSQARVN